MTAHHKRTSSATSNKPQLTTDHIQKMFDGGNWDCNTLSPSGYSLLMWAAANSREDIVEALIVGGAQLEIKDQGTYRGTALHRAARYSSESVMRLLLIHGADVHSTDVDDWTPLHSAAWKGRIGNMDLLLKEGANCSAVTAHSQRTPLHLACASGHITSAILLLPHSNVDAEDSNGMRPVDCIANLNLKRVFQIASDNAETKRLEKRCAELESECLALRKQGAASSSAAATTAAGGEMQDCFQLCNIS
jgi:ankyrin repeat protein